MQFAIGQQAGKTYRIAIVAPTPIVEMAESSGGLMAYAYDQDEMATQNARQIDQIVKSAKPGDIPFYQATRFLLIINLKTAKAFDITIPSSLLASANEVIE